MRSKVGCLSRSGSPASQARSNTGPSGTGSLTTATSSSAPFPHTPQEELVKKLRAVGSRVSGPLTSTVLAARSAGGPTARRPSSSPSP